MEVGASIAAVTASPDGRHLLLGGRDVLKVVGVDSGGGWREVRNLRSGRKKGLEYSVVTASWHPTLPHLIATGSTNGSVMTMDVTRSRVGAEQSFRHSMNVNRVAWHPSEPGWLLTGSQDGTARVWDVRVAPAAGEVADTSPLTTAVPGAYQYSPAASAELATVGVASSSGGLVFTAGEQVRDVAFDPFHPTTFAAALENGTIQLWDLRNTSRAYHHFGAHTGLVSTLAFHPTQPDVLASGGRDCLVRVWHTGTAATAFTQSLCTVSERDGCGCHGGAGVEVGGAMQLASFVTVASVGQVAWRSTLPPGTCLAAADLMAAAGVAQGGEHATGHGSMPLPCAIGPHDYQIATCSSVFDAACYVWDVRHPFLPVAAFKGHKDVTTGMLWSYHHLPTSWGSGVSSSAVGHDLVASTTAPPLPPRPCLLSTGKDGRLLVHTPATATRPHMHLRTSVLALSAGEISWAHQPIQRRQFWDDELAGAPLPGPPPLPSCGAGGRAAVSGGGGKGKGVHLPTTAQLWVMSSDPTKLSAAEASWRYERATFPTPASVERGLAVASPLDRAGLPTPLTDAFPIRDMAAAAFDTPAHILALLALMYVTEGAPVDALCRHNADVALQLGLVETSCVWQVTAALWAPPAYEHASGGDAPPQRATGVEEAGSAASSGVGVEPLPTLSAPIARRQRAVVDAEMEAAAAAASSSGGGELQDGTDLGRPGRHGDVDVDGVGGDSSSTSHASYPVAGRPDRHERRLSSDAMSSVSTSPGSLQLSVLEGGGAEGEDGVPVCPPSPRLTLSLSPLLSASHATLADDGDGAAPPARAFATRGVVPGFIVGLLEALAVVNPTMAGMASEAAGVSLPPLAAAHAGDTAASASSSTAPLASDGHGVGASASPAGPGGSPFTTLPGLPTLSHMHRHAWHACRMSIMTAILHHYADRGDVQLCVTLCRVVGAELEERVGLRMLRHWLVSYIDLLHRLKLWAPASTVMARSRDTRVREMNKQHTSVPSSCTHCGLSVEPLYPPRLVDAATTATGHRVPTNPYLPASAPLPSPSLDASDVEAVFFAHAPDGTVTPATLPGVVPLPDPTLATTPIGTVQAVAPRACLSCHFDVATCAVCMQPVRGVYVWCQGCGHGGHLEHMTEWFTLHGSLCPTGCMHVCSLQGLTTHNFRATVGPAV